MCQVAQRIRIASGLNVWIDSCGAIKFFAPSTHLLLPSCAVADDTMKQYTSIVRDKMLLETLSYGVGLYHSGLSAAERLLVQQLHSSGAIQVVVVAEESAWGLQMSSHLVVIVDTKRFTENGCVFARCRTNMALKLSSFSETVLGKSTYSHGGAARRHCRH